MKKAISSIILIFSIHILQAQSVVSYDDVEAKTMNYYFAAKWDSMIIVGNEALKNNIDYFYLRTRLGYAEFIKEHYRKAIRHFEKALSFNSYDEFSKYYLYLSYINGGYSEEAKFFGQSLNDSLKKQLNIESPKFISGLYLEFDYGFPDSKRKSLPRNLTFLVSKKSNSNLRYFTLGLNHSIGKSVSLFHSLNFYTGNSIEAYSAKPIIETPLKTGMTDYYFSPAIRLFRKTVLQPFVHFAKVGQQITFLAPPPMLPPPGVIPPVNVGTIDTVFRDFSTGISIARYLQFGSLALGFSYNHFANRNFYQQNIDFVWYPFPKNNFYSKSQIQHVIPGEANSNNQWAFTQTFGNKITSKLWLELFLTQGNITNSNINNGYLLYNGSDSYRRIIGSTLYFYSKINIFFRFQFTQMQTSIWKYEQGSDNISFYQTSNYNKQIITGGLLWKF